MSVPSQKSKGQWKNWFENLSCEAVIIDAATEEDVSRAVRYAGSNGVNLRVAGTGHSNVALVPNPGIVVLTDRLKGLLAHDAEKRTVTLAAGTKIRAMGEMLWEHGLSLSNQGDIDTQSIVGAISTGTHGTGINLTNLSARVRSMRLVDANGDLQELGEGDEHRLRAARVSMGMLGAITAVELEVSPAYHLHEWIGFMPYRAAAEIENEMNARFRHFTYFWCPNAKSERFISTEGVIKEGQTDIACVRIFDPEPIEIGELEKYTYRRRHDRSYRIFAEDYIPEFDEMEYMVPLELGRECFEELISTLHETFHDLAIPTEVRVTAGDDNYLSEYQGAPRRAISLAAHINGDNDEFFAACDAVFARYQGRPHWAKANCMTKARLQELYPHFNDFVAVRRQMDPNGVFLNDYLRRWFE
jgi:FAD/FMN-containing dehydrogenase